VFHEVDRMAKVALRYGLYSIVMNLEQVKLQFPQTVGEIENLEAMGLAHRTSEWLNLLELRQTKTVCWLLGKIGSEQDADWLTSVLQAENPQIWRDAATALSAIATTAHLPSLLSIMIQGVHSLQRECAAYTLSFFKVGSLDREAMEMLLQVALNRSEVPSIRAQAMEGLGNQFSQSLSKQFEGQVISSIVECLDDGEAEVRFWACFALGALRASEALPKLKLLAHSDRSVVEGWWSIAKEAQDSISLIDNFYANQSS
jgi:HEAT repeat protein